MDHQTRQIILPFLRRRKTLLNLTNQGIETLRNDVDICDYTFSDFLEEICWQVSDNLDEKIQSGLIHLWIKRNFEEHIRNKFDELIELEGCNDYSDEDDDDDYYSGHLYGVDNNQ